MRIHFLAATLVLGISLQAGLPAAVLALLILTVSVVLALEVFNSALESAVDLFTKNMHPLAGRAKDMAAGSVLIASFFSVAIALVIIRDYHQLLYDGMQRAWAHPGGPQWVWLALILLQAAGLFQRRGRV